MTDLEMTKLCAEAMGHIAELNWGPICQIRSEPGIGVHRFAFSTNGYWTSDYDPLHDDAQAMALVKKLGLSVESSALYGRPISRWTVQSAGLDGRRIGFIHSSTDLNRAICECVAKMEKAKNG